MKILIVAPQPFFEERGTPIAVRMLVETLRDQGHEVDLLVYHCGKHVDLPEVRIWRSGRPPFVGNVPIGISWQKLVCDVWLIGKLLTLLRNHDFDVIHAVEEAIFPAAVLAGWSGRKLVYDMDSSLVEQLIDKWWLLRLLGPVLTAIERAAVRRTHIALPVCEDLAARIRPWVGPQRVFVLPDVPVGDPPNAAGVGSLRFHLRPNDVLGLYVGNLERYQGIGLMLEALARLEESCPFRMVVIGGSQRDIATYRNRAEALALGERVKFIGPRPLKELNAYLSQADILISPRIKGQNTPMKVYSYMQSGKAILATAIRSHTQVLDHECAELFPTEPQAMAKGIAQLTADPLRRRRLGKAARVRADRDYSHDAYCRRLAEAYAVLGDPGPYPRRSVRYAEQRSAGAKSLVTHARVNEHPGRGS